MFFHMQAHNILNKFWAFIINLFLLRWCKILQLHIRHILRAEHLLDVGKNALQEIKISILLLLPIIMFEISVNSILFSLYSFHNIFIVCSIETNFLISSFILFSRCECCIPRFFYDADIITDIQYKRKNSRRHW